ncbi:hypothetical protein F5Y18DRAFT_249032 [Xylariaceae sp. FL1019]|nr:hypothetical protein F5Y18DRAFT_249032 [Xylariaceae sp. FL1019]
MGRLTTITYWAVALSSSIVAATYPECTTQKAPNLLTNPSFEDGTAGWTYITPGGSPSVSNAQALDGSKSLLVPPTAAYSIVQQTLNNLVVGETYTFSISYKGVVSEPYSLTEQCLMYFYHDSLAQANLFINKNLQFNHNLNADWQTLEASYTATSSTLAFAYYFTCSPYRTPVLFNLYIDNAAVRGPSVEVCATPEPTPTPTPIPEDTPTPSPTPEDTPTPCQPLRTHLHHRQLPKIRQHRLHRLYLHLRLYHRPRPCHCRLRLYRLIPAILPLQVIRLIRVMLPIRAIQSIRALPPLQVSQRHPVTRLIRAVMHIRAIQFLQASRCHLLLLRAHLYLYRHRLYRLIPAIRFLRAFRCHLLSPQAPPCLSRHHPYHLILLIRFLRAFRPLPLFLRARLCLHRLHLCHLIPAIRFHRASRYHLLPLQAHLCLCHHHPCRLTLPIQFLRAIQHTAIQLFRQAPR